MKPAFIHISKNAGTSIASLARNSVTVAGHRTAAGWVAEHGREASIFAVVRNPYQRVMSEYCYRRQRHDGGEKNPHLRNLTKPFDEWVISTFRDGELRTKAYFERTGVTYNAQNMIDDTLIWFLPQTRWLSDPDGELLVDDILRHETLAADWRKFAAKYGFECELPHLNASPAPPDVVSLYSDEIRDVVFDYYRDDFDTFGYHR